MSNHALYYWSRHPEHEPHPPNAGFATPADPTPRRNYFTASSWAKAAAHAADAAMYPRMQEDFPTIKPGWLMPTDPGTGFILVLVSNECPEANPAL